MKQGAKSLQKIRQVRDCICETKKQKNKQGSKLIIVHKADQKTMQIAKLKQSKKMQH